MALHLAATSQYYIGFFALTVKTIAATISIMPTVITAIAQTGILDGFGESCCFTGCGAFSV
jgi:hypothetical protein